MTFLANMLREEGGYEYKKAIVNTIISIIEENPEAKEAGKIFLINLFRFVSLLILSMKKEKERIVKCMILLIHVYVIRMKWSSMKQHQQ